MHLQPNTLLQGGKYKIIRHISSGGFGNTYEGELVLIHRRVAIKEFFVKDFCNRDEMTSRVTVATQSKLGLIERLKQKFMAEAAHIWQFNHPNIVRVTDVFEENGTAYYVMDYVDGLSLQGMLKRNGAMSEARALRYIRQVADALQYVHAQKLLHLDLKPGNIMVDANDNAILIDFGAAKQYDEQGENTSTLLGLNTIGYAPPEQMSRSFSDFNPAADVYALGATLYRMLTNVTPPDAIMLMSGDEELEPLPSAVSASTREAVAKAMIPQRKRRTQSVGEFLTQLNNQLDASEPEEDVTVLDVEETVVEGPYNRKLENRTFNVKGVSFKMIAIEGGNFRIGSDDSGAYVDEKPVHDVTLSSYYIGETPVTQELWRAVMGNNPSHFKGDKLPVEYVSWDDCQIFIGRLNKLTGQTFRLPTEAEWEYAARGGQRSLGYKYSGSDDVDEVAWYDENSHTRMGWFGSRQDQQTHPVATKKANELGFYDMSGNVWEWCQDWYGKYSSSAQTNPQGPSSGSYRVFRGGSWRNSARGCSSAIRGRNAPASRYGNLGLRLAL